MSSLWSLCSGDKRARPALRGVSFLAGYRANISAYANDIAVFMFRLSDIETVKKGIVRYEQIVGTLKRAKICGSVSREMALLYLDLPAGVTDPFAFLGWDKVRPPTGVKLVLSSSKGKSTGEYMASKAVVLKWQDGGVGRVHLPLDPLRVVCGCCNNPSPRCFGEVESWSSADRSAINVFKMGA